MDSFSFSSRAVGVQASASEVDSPAEPVVVARGGRRWTRLLIVLGSTFFLLVLSVGLMVYRGSQEVPEFYRQALAVEPQQQAQSSKALLQQATSLVNEARQEGSWEATFTEEQINGWLAVDLVKNHPKLLSRQLQDPRVAILPEGVTLGCRWESEQLSSICWLDVELYLAEPNVLALRIRGARAGSVPLPLNKILDGVSKAADKMDLQIEWRQSDGDPVAMITIPPPKADQDSAVLVETLELGNGAVYLAGKTVPRSTLSAEEMTASEELYSPLTVRQPGPQQQVVKRIHASAVMLKLQR